MFTTNLKPTNTSAPNFPGSRPSLSRSHSFQTNKNINTNNNNNNESAAPDPQLRTIDSIQSTSYQRVNASNALGGGGGRLRTFSGADAPPAREGSGSQGQMGSGSGEGGSGSGSMFLSDDVFGGSSKPALQPALQPALPKFRASLRRANTVPTVHDGHPVNSALGVGVGVGSATNRAAGNGFGGGQGLMATTPMSASTGLASMSVRRSPPLGLNDDIPRGSLAGGLNAKGARGGGGLVGMGANMNAGGVSVSKALDQKDVVGQWYGMLQVEAAKVKRNPGKGRYLRELYAEATTSISVDAHRNDPRFLDIWLAFIQLQRDLKEDNSAIRDSYKFLKSAGVGTKIAKLYVAWADFELSAAQVDKAKTILLNGLSANAQPIEEIRRALQSILVASTTKPAIPEPVDSASLPGTSGINGTSPQAVEVGKDVGSISPNRFDTASPEENETIKPRQFTIATKSEPKATERGMGSDQSSLMNVDERPCAPTSTKQPSPQTGTDGNRTNAEANQDDKGKTDFTVMLKKNLRDTHITPRSRIAIADAVSSRVHDRNDTFGERSDQIAEFPGARSSLRKSSSPTDAQTPSNTQPSRMRRLARTRLGPPVRSLLSKESQPVDPLAGNPAEMGTVSPSEQSPSNIRGESQKLEARVSSEPSEEPMTMDSPPRSAQMGSSELAAQSFVMQEEQNTFKSAAACAPAAEPPPQPVPQMNRVAANPPNNLRNALVEVPFSTLSDPIPVPTKMGPAYSNDKSHICVNNVTYKRIELIGRGGSSKVYKIMSENGKLFALKKVKLHGYDESAVEGYTNEIALLRRLSNNERIIRLVDAEISRRDGYILMVLEYGEIDLAHLLQKEQGKRLSLNFIRMYWEQMLKAVHAIHEESIIHSDLKPANFMLVEGALKLIDFGIAKSIPNDTTNIHREHQTGTINYMAPEAISFVDLNGNKRQYLKLGRSSDVWSLGCILYQLVYGRPPFAHLMPVMRKLQCIVDPNFEIEFPLVEDESVLEVIKSCLQRDPKKRMTIPELLAHTFLNPSVAIAANGTSASVMIGKKTIDHLLRQLAILGPLSAQPTAVSCQTRTFSSTSTALKRGKPTVTSAFATSFNSNPQLFYQTVVLSDGSSFTIRTTTPRPLLKMTKDTRNHPLWNPERRQELDDKSTELNRFARRFGGLDLLTDSMTSGEGEAAARGAGSADVGLDADDFGFAMGEVPKAAPKATPPEVQQQPTKKGKKK
ncbi:hypothetical protein HK102_000967 [Quaeritorhiza haematococci]|nr:hypothetical protein HK102_000967 [Quaeritorhiza haematococci]